MAALAEGTPDGGQPSSSPVTTTPPLLVYTCMQCACTLIVHCMCSLHKTSNQWNNVYIQYIVQCTLHIHVYTCTYV